MTEQNVITHDQIIIQSLFYPPSKNSAFFFTARFFAHALQTTEVNQTLPHQ